MKRGLFIFFILFCLMLGFATLHAQNKIIADGAAAVHKNVVDIARDKAVDNALRNAVEMAVGAMISSRTMVENFRVKLDQILSESKGYINSYEVISEEREGDTYRVTIEADVRVGSLKNKSQAINLIFSRKSKPRLMILFSEQAQKDCIAEGAMVKFFLSKGFKLIDPKHPLATDHEAAMEVGHRYEAEVMIVGSVETASIPFKLDTIEMHSTKAIVSAKVIKVDTGDIIATHSDTETMPGIGNTIKPTVERASAKLAKELMKQILDCWSSELTNTVTVKLLASGLSSYDNLTRFKDLLMRDVKGVKELIQRSYTHGCVELDMEIEGNTQGLADDIAATTFNGRPIQIVKVTQNKLEVRLSP